MKRIIITLFLGLIAGGVGGFAAGIFIYPFWFLNDVAAESLQTNVERAKLAGGIFIDVNPKDPVHFGSGQVTTYREPNGNLVIHLHEDFEVGPGPRFHIYLVDHADVRSRDDFRNSDKVDLGRLRNFRGSQVYNVPAGVDIASYKSIVIWCKEFGVLISSASLLPEDVAAATDGKLGNT